VLVRDGFYFWAFVFGPVWMLWRRLWLVLFLFVVAMAVVAAGFWYFRVDESVQGIVFFLLALLVGIEAASLRRWTLARKGWKNTGVVVGDDIEAAERRFFAAWIAGEGETPAPPPAVPAPLPMRAPPHHARDVIGLFPEPGASR
jgi:signal transduction histidine kinase